MSYVTSAGRSAPTLSNARIDRISYDKPDGYRWVRLGRIDWTDPLGRQRVWEMAERCHAKAEDEVDGVAILCLVHNGVDFRDVGGREGEDVGPDVIFVSQYRPPIAAECIELPAGLIDGGEDAASAALRELEEETGYVVGTDAIRYVSGPCPSDPGMSNANMRWVVVDVDGTDPRHHRPEAKPDDGEFIRTHRVPLLGALEWLEAREKEGMVIDARLYGLMIGLCKGNGVSPSREKGRVTALGEMSRTALILSVGAILGSIFTRLLLKR